MPEALNLIDDQRPARRDAAIALLDALESRVAFPGAHRLGITGTPGAGKSTLIAALLRALRAKGETLAVLAVAVAGPLGAAILLWRGILQRSRWVSHRVEGPVPSLTDRLGLPAVRAGPVEQPRSFGWGWPAVARSRVVRCGRVASRPTAIGVLLDGIRRAGQREKRGAAEAQLQRAGDLSGGREQSFQERNLSSMRPAYQKWQPVALAMPHSFEGESV